MQNSSSSHHAKKIKAILGSLGENVSSDVLTPFIEKTFQLFNKLSQEDSFDETRFLRFLGILQIFVNSNLIVPKSNYFVMSGLNDSSIEVDFNDRFESNSLFLNQNFCISMNLTMDLESIESADEQVYLFYYKSNIPESGYGIYIIKNELWFFYQLPSKTPNSLNEFLVF